VRVLICEDAPGYRLMLRVSLEDTGMEVVGEAASWDEAVAQVEEHQPDVLLVDLWLPTRDDDALRRLRDAAPHAQFVALTGLSVDEATEAIGALGIADLILSKREAMDSLLTSLRAHLDAPGEPAEA
jgi:DNA-binding NarL/FixJ family response regulator